MQLTAGYILDFLKNRLLADNDQLEILSLIESLCYFEVEEVSESEETSKPELAVLNNLISRGIPTRPSLFIEKWVLHALQLGEVRTGELGDLETIPNQLFNSKIGRASCRERV